MKKDLIERLRATLDTERERAELVAIENGPRGLAAQTEYEEAKADTDKVLAKLEKLAKRAAWFAGQVGRPANGGPIIPPPGVDGLAAAASTTNAIAIVIDPTQDPLVGGSVVRMFERGGVRI